MATETLYGGIVYKFPEAPKYGDVCNFNKPKKLQKWEREELPEIFDDLEFDVNGEPMYEEAHLKYIDEEMRRIEHGHWIFVNGKLTYLTGVYYYYLQWWVLEDGYYPNYRDSDRRFALVLDYVKNHKHLLGYIRIKKRREGATSFASCSITKVASTTYDANCGIISKTGEDAKEVFLNIQKAYYKLPIFMKPRVEDEDSKTEIVFKKKKSRKINKDRKKGEVIGKDTGLNSKINYKNTALNSYDSGRETEILVDEGGKWPKDVPINQYLPIVKKTLLRGGVKVGILHLPSTVNPGDKGGREFKAVWDDSDQSKSEIPPTKLIRYFSSAADGYDPYIGEYGESIIEKPTPSQAAYLIQKYGKDGIDVTVGAREYILRERALITDPVALAEETRMNPLTEREAFMIDDHACAFNSINIQCQIEELEEHPVKLRQVRFFLQEDGETVDFVDDPKGPWYIYKFPLPHEQNAYVTTERGRCPLHWPKYKSGIDPQRNSFTKGKKDLSKTAAWIGEAYDPNDPDNTGMPIAFYYDRPRLKAEMFEQIRLACMFYSCKAHFEHDAGDDYFDYFKNRGMLEYIRWTPTCAIDPLQKKKSNRVPGTQSRDPFSLSKQLEVCVAYIEYYCYKIKFIQLLRSLLSYEHDNRTVYDEAVAFMMLLLDMAGDTRPKPPDMPKGRAIIKTYQIAATRGR